jgi:hypothetical protein
MNVVRLPAPTPEVLLFWLRRAARKTPRGAAAPGSAFAALGRLERPDPHTGLIENDRDDLVGSHASGRGRFLVRSRVRLGRDRRDGRAFDIHVLCGRMEHSLAELMAAAAASRPRQGAASPTCAGART